MSIVTLIIVWGIILATLAVVDILLLRSSEDRSEERADEDLNLWTSRWNEEWKKMNEVLGKIENKLDAIHALLRTQAKIRTKQ